MDVGPRQVEGINQQVAAASTFLAKALLPLMSAKMVQAIGDSPGQFEVRAAPNTGHSPTRWAVDREKSNCRVVSQAIAMHRLLTVLQLLRR